MTSKTWNASLLQTSRIESTDLIPYQGMRASPARFHLWWDGFPAPVPLSLQNICSIHSIMIDVFV